jgi:hypothetical protein
LKHKVLDASIEFMRSVILVQEMKWEREKERKGSKFNKLVWLWWG